MLEAITLDKIIESLESNNFNMQLIKQFLTEVRSLETSYVTRFIELSNYHVKFEIYRIENDIEREWLASISCNFRANSFEVDNSFRIDTYDGQELKEHRDLAYLILNLPIRKDN